ncbi:hypothetical protein BD414DRAFT_481634 [Trametes punicea]|nr:hypothetical protein BD414DRAFT_481634 [Trametes punicea]
MKPARRSSVPLTGIFALSSAFPLWHGMWHVRPRLSYDRLKDANTVFTHWHSQHEGVSLARSQSMTELTTAMRLYSSKLALIDLLHRGLRSTVRLHRLLRTASHIGLASYEPHDRLL